MMQRLSSATLSVLVCLCQFSALLVLASPVLAADLSDVHQSLIKDIQQAQRSLSLTDTRISQQRAALAEQITRKDNTLQQLREKAAAITRGKDEQTLDINQLTERLTQWQEQRAFQAHALISFVQQQSVTTDVSAIEADLSAGFEPLLTRISALDSALMPTSRQQSVIMATGQVEAANVLQAGPVQWFWQPQQQRGGLLSNLASTSANQNTATELPNVAMLFTAEQTVQLQTLFEQGKASVTLDPTLEQAIELAQHDETLTQHLAKGGVWAWPIMLFAAVATVIALFKAIQLLRLPRFNPLLVQRINMMTAGNNPVLAESVASLSQPLQGIQRQLIDIVQAVPVSQARDDQLFNQVVGYRHKLEKGIGAIAMVASVSPLLGLLGTVSGMIETFKLMTIFGAGDPAAVSGGISEALVTTELGLVVAIPALILHALLNRMVKNHNTDSENLAVALSQLTLECQADALTATTTEPAVLQDSAKQHQPVSEFITTQAVAPDQVGSPLKESLA